MCCCDAAGSASEADAGAADAGVGWDELALEGRAANRHLSDLTILRMTGMFP